MLSAAGNLPPRSPVSKSVAPAPQSQLSTDLLAGSRRSSFHISPRPASATR